MLEPRTLGAGLGGVAVLLPHSRPYPSSPTKRTGRKMSAGLCALFLRLPQLPSVEANAASNGRVRRGWAGHSSQWQRWTAQALYLQTPGGGWQREQPPMVRGVEVAPCQLGHHHQELWVFPCAQAQARLPLPHQPGMDCGPVSSSCMKRPGSPPTAHSSLQFPPTKSTELGVSKAVYRA